MPRKALITGVTGQEGSYLADEYNFHHVAFAFKYLEKLLAKVGFKNIHRYDWRETIHKDYDDYS